MTLPSSGPIDASMIYSEYYGAHNTQQVDISTMSILYSIADSSVQFSNFYGLSAGAELEFKNILNTVIVNASIGVYGDPSSDIICSGMCSSPTGYLTFDDSSIYVKVSGADGGGPGDCSIRVTGNITFKVDYGGTTKQLAKVLTYNHTFDSPPTSGIIHEITTVNDASIYIDGTYPNPFKITADCDSWNFSYVDFIPGTLRRIFVDIWSVTNIESSTNFITIANDASVFWGVLKMSNPPI